MWTVLQGHLGLGCATMAIFSYYFGYNYIITENAKRRIFMAMPFISSFFSTFYYVILLIIYNTEDSALTYINPIFIRFFAWFLTTPPLLAAIALLEPSTVITDIVFLCGMDAMMIVSGYLSHIATHPAAIWTFYMCGISSAYAIICMMIRKYHILNRIKIKNINIKTYRFLSIYTLIIWSIFPIIFILSKTGQITYDIETILYVYLDILSKGVFGLILVGVHVMLENKPTRVVRFARAIVHVYPVEDTVTEGDVITDTSTPASSLDTLTTSEEEFITGVSPHSIISVKNEEIVELPVRGSSEY